MPLAASHPSAMLLSNANADEPNGKHPSPPSLPPLLLVC